jgi:hypothetical protein
MAPIAHASGPTVGVTPQHAHGRDAAGERRHRATGKRIWAAARQTDDGKPLGAQRVGHEGHVGGPLGHRLVAMRVGKMGARPLHRDYAKAELFGRAPASLRELAATTGRPVEPQHDLARGIAVFGEAEPAPVG